MKLLRALLVALLAPLAAACGSLELRPTPDVEDQWERDGGSGFQWMDGDVVVSFGGRKNFAQGEFPVNGTVTNRGRVSVRVVVRRATEAGGVIGKRSGPRHSKERVPVVDGEPFDVTPGATRLVYLLPDRPWTDERPKEAQDTVSYDIEIDTTSGVRVCRLRMKIERRVNDFDRWWDPIWMVPLTPVMAPLAVTLMFAMWVLGIPTC